VQFGNPWFKLLGCVAGQVDWAALAQAWIAQKESTGAVPDQPGIQPNGQEMQNMEPPAHNNHGAFPGDPNFGRGWQPGEKCFSLTMGILKTENIK